MSERMTEQTTALEAIQLVAEAMMAGCLDKRCDLSGRSEQDAELLSLVNRMLDSLIAPMRLAGDALNEIAHGRIPPFVIDDYQGEYNQIKQNNKQPCWQSCTACTKRPPT